MNIEIFKKTRARNVTNVTNHNNQIEKERV